MSLEPNSDTQQFSLDIGQKFQDINENLSSRENTGATKISLSLETNAKKGLLQSMKNPAISLEPRPMKKTRTVIILVAVSNLTPMPDQTASKTVIQKFSSMLTLQQE